MVPWVARFLFRPTCCPPHTELFRTFLHLMSPIASSSGYNLLTNLHGPVLSQYDDPPSILNGGRIYLIGNLGWVVYHCLPRTILQYFHRGTFMKSAQFHSRFAS